MGRWLAGLIVLALGVAWFYGDTWFAEDEPVVKAKATQGPVVIPRSNPATEGAEARDQRAKAASGMGGARQPDAPPASLANAAAPASKPRETANAPASLDLEQTLARAKSQAAAGDRRGAASVLRQALGRAGSPFESGRLALHLAPLEARPAEARRLYGQALAQGAVLDPEFVAVGEALRQANRDPRASLLPLLRTKAYEVRPNDSLWKLCNKTLPQEFGVSPEVGLVRLVNGMSGDTLQLGQSLLIPLDPLRIEIDRHQHGLVAWLGDVALAAYQVGLGRENRTPSGEFVVEVKQIEPDWYRAGRKIPFGDPENILGTRWMGFQNHPGVMGYGIHGTARPDTVGLDESMGCVRMRNDEVEELFELVPRGTKVSIP